MKNTRKILAITIIIAMIYSVIGSILNKSYAYIVETNKATQYQFNPQDVLDWAANVGAGNESTTVFPFITVKPTEDDFEGDIENKVWPNYVALTINTSACDNKINATDSADLYIGGISRNDSFEIVNQLSRDLGIDASEISLKINVELRDDNKTITWDIENGECKQSAEEVRAGLDEIYEYCKKCYTTKNYQPDAQKNMSGTAEEWEEEVDELVDGYIEEDGLSDEEALNEAKGDMINKYFFGIIEEDATLPDGTVYCLVLGGEGEYKLNWLLAKKDIFVKPEPDPEPTPEPEPEKKTDDTVAKSDLARTGESVVLISVIAVIAISATALYFKNKKYNKIK